jgi:serine/threonine protein kinase
MSLSDEPKFLRNCPASARNALEPIIREFIECTKKQATPSIQEFIDRAPLEHQAYLLHELLLEEIEALGAPHSSDTVESYRKIFANFPEVLDVIFGPVPSESDSDSNSSEDLLLEQVGRYRIIRRIGKGGFGVVYLADDTQLGRQVALKAPRSDRFQSAAERESFINEARTVARLGAHPNIVAMYDFLFKESRVYVVQEYVQGEDLRKRLKLQPGGFEAVSAVDILIQIARAMAFAHESGVYHRDIKPENILIDGNGIAKVGDFGLAIHEDERRSKRGDRSGSPHYLSPERIRGESHRIDGRSDLWSLGVMLYELSTGRRPFQGATKEELAEEICYREPVPMRQWRMDIPLELERICNRCLAKSKSDRYPTAHDLIEDLQRWLGTEPPPLMPLSRSRNDALEGLVPRGLRAFDREDHDAFLDLLPGPRDREGLPDVLAFWKKRFEEQGSLGPMSVGVLYGPSGSGKTSLIKAGLLPRLSSRIEVLYVDHYAPAREASLRVGISKFTGPDTDGLSLPELATLVRRGNGRQDGKKLLLVFDQFEQWFSLNDSEKKRWVDTLRQCDGERLAALLMIRDDFWMQTTRLMSSIEVPLVEGVNTGSIDLFSMGHAQNVLRWFGLAYGCLVCTPGEDLPGEARDFLKGSIERISEDGKVIPVKLAMFVEMMRDREWTPATLQKVGGFDGLGVLFLEELFSSTHANAENRHHREGAKRILSGLLPRGFSGVRDATRTIEQLEQISGYRNRAGGDFAALLNLLDRKLRLITPVDLAITPASEITPAPDVGYKLSHDYLIASVRDWSTLKQKETPRGRAELVLQERAAAWSSRKESQQLPTLFEWLSIRFWTRPSRWTSTETELMGRSDRMQVLRLSALVLTAMAGTWLIWRTVDSSRRNELIRIDAIQSMDLASWDGTNPLIPTNASSGFLTKVSERRQVMPEGTAERLKFDLALEPSDGSLTQELIERLSISNAIQTRAILLALSRHGPRVSDYCERSLADPKGDSVLGLASGLAMHAKQSKLWTDDDRLTSLVVRQMMDAEPTTLPVWIDQLEPAKGYLLPTLSNLLTDYEKPLTTPRANQALAIIERYADSQEYLNHLLTNGHPAVFERLFEKYRAMGQDQAIAMMRAELNKGDDLSDDALRANAALGLLRLGQEADVLRFLTVSDRPDPMTWFIFQADQRGIPGELLIQCIEAERSRVKLEDLTKMDRLLRRQHYLRLYGLILALGQCDATKIPPDVRASFQNRMTIEYREHPSRAVHSALGWLIKRWGMSQWLDSVGDMPKPYDPDGLYEWYVVKIPPELKIPSEGANQADPMHMTMMVFSAEDLHPKYRNDLEPGHRFSLCDRELTWGLYSQFDGGALRKKTLEINIPESSQLGPAEPVIRATWVNAVDYCNWLTQSAGAKPSNEFRLPNMAEWNCAAAAGMITDFSFGNYEDLFQEFDWYRDNAKFIKATGSLPPSPSGLFDIHGNVSEIVKNAIESNPNIVRYRGSNWNDSMNLGGSRFDNLKMRLGRSEGLSTLGFRVAQDLGPLE